MEYFNYVLFLMNEMIALMRMSFYEGTNCLVQLSLTKLRLH